MAVRRSTTFFKIPSNAICPSKPTFSKFFSQQSRKSTDGSIDPDYPEVKHHGNLAQRWWDMETVKTLHNLNEARVPFIREGIYQSILQNEARLSSRSDLVGVDILDVGCAGGILSEALARLKANVTGIDPSLDLITIAQEHAEKDPHLKDFLRYENENIRDYCQRNMNKFDVVAVGGDSFAVSEVIEHISAKEKFVEDCLACLKPGGSIFFTTPNKTLAAKLLIIMVAEGFEIIPKGTHNYEKFISVEDLSKLLEANGCSIKRVQGIFLNLLTKKSRLSASKCLMYALHAQKTG